MMDAKRNLALADQFISKAEAATALGVGLTKLDELLLGRTIISAKVGRRRLVSARSLDAFMRRAVSEEAK